MESQLSSPKIETIPESLGGENLNSPTSVLPKEVEEWVEFDESSFHKSSSGNPLELDFSFREEEEEEELIDIDFPLQNALPNQFVQRQDGTRNIQFQFPDITSHNDTSTEGESFDNNNDDNVDGCKMRRFPLHKQSAMKIVNPDLQRQRPFRATKKIAMMMKGASTLSFDEYEKYDTSAVIDPEAAPSKKVMRSSLTNKNNTNLKGDDDVWVEKIYYSKHDRKQEIRVFVSKKTGNKVRDEPPTGASRVIYLK